MRSPKSKLRNLKFAARHRALQEWRLLPEKADPDRHQHSAATLVAALLDKLGLGQRMREEEVAAAWAAIVGDFSARHSRPMRLKYRILTVAVAQPAVLFTLDRSKGTILARLQERFGSSVIRDLKFRAG
ncbi:MAG: DciA family protein [Verrucomicrobiales bacterium]